MNNMLALPSTLDRSAGSATLTRTATAELRDSTTLDVRYSFVYCFRPQYETKQARDRRNWRNASRMSYAKEKAVARACADHDGSDDDAAVGDDDAAIGDDGDDYDGVGGDGGDGAGAGRDHDATELQLPAGLRGATGRAVDIAANFHKARNQVFLHTRANLDVAPEPDEAVPHEDEARLDKETVQALKKCDPLCKCKSCTKARPLSLLLAAAHGAFRRKRKTVVVAALIALENECHLSGMGFKGKKPKSIEKCLNCEFEDAVYTAALAKERAAAAAARSIDLVGCMQRAAGSAHPLSYREPAPLVHDASGHAHVGKWTTYLLLNGAYCAHMAHADRATREALLGSMLRGADGDVLGGAELLKLNETMVRKIGEQVCVTNDSFVANDEARRLTAKLIGNRQLMLVVLILPAAGYAAAVAADAQLRRAAEASYRPRKAAAAKRPLTDAAARQLSVLKECLVHSNATLAALPQGAKLTAAEAAFCDEREAAAASTDKDGGGGELSDLGGETYARGGQASAGFRPDDLEYFLSERLMSPQGKTIASDEWVDDVLFVAPPEDKRERKAVGNVLVSYVQSNGRTRKVQQRDGSSKTYDAADRTTQLHQIGRGMRGGHLEYKQLQLLCADEERSPDTGKTWLQLQNEIDLDRLLCLATLYANGKGGRPLSDATGKKTKVEHAPLWNAAT